MSSHAQSATWREIHAQPQIWRDWGGALDVAASRAWIGGLGVGEIWLCGAGSSAYIGEVVAAGLEGAPGPRIRAVATTDIVACPHGYLRGEKRLVISFGRSGNSAESRGLMAAMAALVPDWPSLNITCNAQSAMADRPETAHARALILPDACHDAGFAMTSSFSTMLLTALALLDGDMPAAAAPERLARLADDLAGLLPRYAAAAAAMAAPSRAVFIGTGPMAHAARECALKVMELSAGQIPALWDSALGFRHGPKSFVDAGTHIWLLRHPQRYPALYEGDLWQELAAQFPRNSRHALDLPDDWPAGWNAAWGAPLLVAMAQVVAVMQSARLGLNIDDPFAGRGTLTRVVADVRLHPVGPQP